MDQHENNPAENAADKKKRTAVFGADYLSFLCMELYLSVNAGVPLDESVNMLRDHEEDPRAAAVLGDIYETMSCGEELSSSMRSTGAFPKYVVDMVEIGERTGHLDSTLKALSDYYERQMQISSSIRSAILYPAILLATMLVVIVVLITQVLPIFGDVLEQLGTGMNGFSLFLMNLGLGLRQYWIPIVIVLAVIIGGLAFWLTRPKQRTRFGDFGFSKKIGDAVAASRFASAMAMTMESGLDVDASVDMAERLITNPAMKAKIDDLRNRMNEGASFSEAVEASNVFPGMYSRMLSVAFRAGAADTAMGEIARRTGDEAENAIERLIGRVEPTLVIVLSVIVGLILLSVMLPLMGVMNGIGV